MTATVKLKGVKAHTRYFLADGTRVPGCTTVTGAANSAEKLRTLIRWANNLGLEGIDVEDYTDALADVGTLVHHMILCDFLGKKPDLDAFAPQIVRLAENSFLSYRSWRKEHVVEPLITERPLVSEAHRFGGTLDFYGKVDGALELVDFKSGSGLYPEHFHQVAGGYLLLLEEHGYAVDKITLLNIPRAEDELYIKATMNVTDPAVSKHREMFLCCLRVHQLQSELRPGRRNIKSKKEEAAS